MAKKNLYQIPTVEVAQIRCFQALLDASAATMHVTGGPLEGINPIPDDPSTIGR